MVSMFLTAAIIQERMISQRLPRKTMQEIKRNSLLEIKKIMSRYKSDNDSDTIK